MSAQDTAADPKRSAWVSANAGAGKTYTLANRVTRLLLDGARPERILCLTYTKAAAAEMEGRLFEQLGRWAMASDDALAGRLAAIGACGRDAEGLREARRLFALALETPGGLKIKTIHSFCQDILSRFPLEAGIAPSFRVLDDSTARELRDRARERVLDRAGRSDDRLADAVAALVTETGESQLHSIFEAAFGGDRRKLERFLARTPESSLANAVRAAHGARDSDTPESVAAEFVCDAMREEKRLREIVQWLEDGKDTDRKNSGKLADAIAGRSFEVFARFFLTGEGTLRKQFATKALADARPDLMAALNTLASGFSAIEERRRAAHAAILADAAIALIRAARAEYDTAKRLRSVLDYDDLILATQRLLERREAAQWVLYKLDGGLDHVLIDEAQDTSPEQWNIVKRLTEEFFAGSGIERSRRQRRTIFAVGDEKQSIFSFQGADPREFAVNRQYFAERIGDDSFADVRLDVSRRSTPEILRFVDEVFAPKEARQGVVSDGEPIVHRPHREKAVGFVELWPLTEPEDIPERDYWRPVDVPSRASPAIRLARQIAQCIARWTDGRTCLPGRPEPIRPGDIMVLMPRRDPFAGALIRELKMRSIPVAGADRIRVASHIAVMDLIALGRFALLSDDDLNLAALLRSPLIGISEDELYALAATRSGTLWREVRSRADDNARFGEIAAFLSAVLSRADYMPPYEFYASVLTSHGMRKRILTRLGIEAGDIVDEFLSLCLGYEALNTPSLEGFLHWIEHGDTEVKRDMERARNEVRVMTVHGSKGLEADIVILPDTAGQPGGANNRADILYTDDGPIFPVKADSSPAAVRRAKEDAARRAREEHRRLLYVALTRARDRLIVCGFKGKKALNGDSWYSLAERAAREIGVAVERRGEKFYLLGEADLESKSEARIETDRSIRLDSWTQTDAPSELLHPRLLRPSDAAGTEEPAVQSPAGLRNAERFRRGNLVHAMLAQLPELEPSARSAAALRYLSARGLSENEANTLVEETLAVIEGSEFAGAFSAGSRAETAIVADLPEIADGARVNGRIDRLAVTETEILAVDFKTNRPPPARAEDVPPIYLSQMALYRAALAKIFPGREIACALVWTDGPSLMRLDNAVLDAEIGKIAAGRTKIRANAPLSEPPK